MKNKELMEKLIKKTKSKDIEWRESTYSPNSFETHFLKGYITVRLLESQFGTIVDLLIYNNSGNEVLSNSYSEEFDHENYLLLRELYDLAKSSFYKIDETIEGILDELK